MKTVTLGEICDVISRGITPKYTDKESIIVLNQKCIRAWDVSLDQSRFHDSELKKVSDEKMLRVDDILVCSTGVGTLGRVGQFYGNDTPITVDSHVMIVRPDKQKVFPRFLGYILKSREPEIEAMAEGSTNQTELSRVRLSGMEVQLPDIAEQKRVSGILGNLDEKIELNRAQIQTLESLASAFFQKTFIQNPEAENWETGAISNLVNIYSGYAFKRVDFDDSGRYGLVTIKNVQDSGFVAECTDRLLSIPSNMPDYIKISTGDILLSLTGNVGRVCIALGENLLLNQRVAKIEGKSNNAVAYFMFKEDNLKNLMQEMAHGTAQLNLSPVELKNREYILPPLKIVEGFGSIGESLYEQIIVLLQENQTLAKTRDSLLTKLIK